MSKLAPAAASPRPQIPSSALSPPPGSARTAPAAAGDAGRTGTGEVRAPPPGLARAAARCRPGQQLRHGAGGVRCGHRRRHWRHVDASLTGAAKISRPVRRRHLRLAGLGAIVPVEVPTASPRLAKVPVKLGPRQELGPSPSLEAN